VQQIILIDLAYNWNDAWVGECHVVVLNKNAIFELFLVLFILCGCHY